VETEIEIQSKSPLALKIRATVSGDIRRSPRSALLVHGITTARDEEGIYARMAERLEAAGIPSMRFDFRSHGESEGQAEDLSISGEVADLQAAYEWIAQHDVTPLILAASFGAVSVCLALADGSIEAKALVLWNPVLDLRRTFLEPETDWARRNFARENWTNTRPGVIAIDDGFELPISLLDEMYLVDVIGALAGVSIPTLTVHGDEDSYVPFDVAKVHGVPNEESKFITLAGADHGFGRPHEEEQVLGATLSWFKEHL
jgi:alpha-beta hydrolase superfamily lysophospholipase